MSPKHSAPKRAFTLIELLAVIAVIGILAAILIPAIGSVRKSAAATKTASNLRQIGAGVQMYANEHNFMFPNEDGRLVFSSKTFPQLGYQTNWREAVHRYITTQYDPSNGYNFAVGPDSEIWRAGNAEPLSFHFGVNLFMQFGGLTNPNKFRLNLIPNPSKYVLIAETNSGQHYHDPRVEPDLTGEALTTNRMSHPGGTGFYLFADGHVEQLAGPRHPDQFPEMWDY
jgi:prepilin-type N-terminal cleavage/methylation domain-containing protein/prepilin-type processing-associated H-X9-DG protein